MTSLPKHLRPRWRYLGVAIESDPAAGLTRRDFQRAVWYAGQNLLGDAAAADLDLTVLGFEFADGAGHAVVRTRRDEVDRARAALACVSEVDGRDVGLFVRGVSGTVRACEEKYIPDAPERTDQRQVAFAGAERRAAVRGERVDPLEDGPGATELDLN
ncbi:Rpp14/Pop5 family protein [Halomicrobium salinisoli]|uniref:Rpp14/Pop5 family protein n=1 Tax=Halomicrobium salinisoli TaxID=2878391 RepID=UPI001CF0221E|nr:Rpp14/Pop5 family protein [Halomicrobium salinisoli]